MVQELLLRNCTFEQPPGWVPQLPSLQHLAVLDCTTPCQQWDWKSISTFGIPEGPHRTQRIHQFTISCSKKKKGR